MATITQVQEVIAGTVLKDGYTVEIDNTNGDFHNAYSRVIIKRKCTPRAENTINDIIAKCNTDEELVWRGWTFEPEFMHFFKQEMDHCKA